MKFFANLNRIVLVGCLFLYTSCKKQDTTNNTNNGVSATGSLVFEGAVFQINTTTLGSGTIADRFGGFDPSWTPDGRIIFELTDQVTGKNQNPQIMIANADGSGLTMLNDVGISYTDANPNPKMSKDGKYFCYNFVNGLSSATQGLRIYNMNGIMQTALANLFDGSWAPDGSIVAAGTVDDPAILSGATYTPGTAGLFKISPDFKTITPIGSGLTTPWFPCVSPDGTKIAFGMNNHIWVINMDGTGLKQITTSNGVETNPSWSPDGNSIGALSNAAASYFGGNGYAIVPSNPSSPASVSSSDKVWVADNNSNTGIIEPTGNVSWK